MRNVKELLDEAIYAGNLSENEEEKLYSWIESLILAKRKADEYEAKAKAWDDLNNVLLGKRDGFKSLLFMDENRHDAPIIANEIKNFDGILNLMNDKLSDYESGE